MGDDEGKSKAATAPQESSNGNGNHHASSLMMAMMMMENAVATTTAKTIMTGNHKDNSNNDDDVEHNNMMMMQQQRMEERRRKQANAFRVKSDSLRLSVSNLAAVTGFHPYKNLVALVTDLVYQDWGGKILLEQDAQVLGLTMVSEDEVLLSIATKAGQNTKRALQDAMQAVKEPGARRVASVDQARQMKEKVVTLAKEDGKLNAQELRTLQEGTRSKVDTGYGTAHEDDALDVLERQRGWEIRHRNAEILMWPFQRSDETITATTTSEPPTVTPLGPPRSVATRRQQQQQIQRKRLKTTPPPTSSNDCQLVEETTKSDEQEESSSAASITTRLSSEEEDKDKRSSPPEEKLLSLDGSEKEQEESQANADGITRQVSNENKPCASAVAEMIDLTSDSPTAAKTEEKGDNDNLASQGACVDDNDEEEERKRRNDQVVIDDETTTTTPFCLIVGSVDGIREELVPIISKSDTQRPQNNDDDADEYGGMSWVLRKVIVECKHRMRRIQPVPPVYEQIQATTYCFMYNVTEVDLVQVLRRGKDIIPPKEATDKSSSSSKQAAIMPSYSSSQSSPAKTKAPKSGTRTLDSWLIPSPKKGITSLPEGEQTGSSDGKSPSPSATGPSDAATTTTAASKPAPRAVPKPPPIISVTRISLDDPIMKHRQHWANVILPRVRSFVEAVYRIRREDSKRYRLLMSTSSSAFSDCDVTEEDGWKMLHEECPWLQHCDTAYFRK